MPVLTLCNHKGGTGKTTSTLNIGAAIGLSGFKVLLIDLDPQGFLSRMVGVDEPHPSVSSMALFNSSLKKGSLTPVSFEGFDVIPSSRMLNRQLRRLSRPSDNLWVRESLSLFDEYDLVLIDTAAAVTVYSLAAITAATMIIIPVTPEIQPVYGAQSAHENVGIVRAALNPDLDEPYFLITQVDARKRTHHKNSRYLRAQYGDRVLSQVIRTSAALASAFEAGTTVFDHHPRSRGAQDYANAADTIIRLLGLEYPEM